jgi:SAM-dependent methyltransferase
MRCVRLFRTTPEPSYYDASYFSNSYESPDRCLPRERHAISLLSVKPADVAVDVGCGRGTTIKELARDCGMVVGLDPSSVAVAISKRNTRGLRGCEVIRASAMHLPLKSRSATKVLALEVIEHLDRKDTETAVREIRQILTDNGSLCISTPHVEFPLTLVSKLYRIATRGLRASLHVDEKSERTMRKCLHRAGFECQITLESYAPDQFLKKGSVMEKLIRRFKFPTPYLSAQMWIKAWTTLSSPSKSFQSSR